jgi:hypothetical protein
MEFWKDRRIISHLQTGPADPAVPIWKFLTRC